jgi:1,4-dihydroxy-2-naphthoate polyprenyltransferase
MNAKPTVAAEPSAELLGGDSAAAIARRLLLAVRPQFLTASVLPVLVGTAWGYRVGATLDGWRLLLALVATACVHAASNVLNDVADDLSGSDRINAARLYPFSGGSRFIQNGVMSRGAMGRWGAALLAFGACAGGALILLAGRDVLWFGLVGMALGLAYSLPPVQLSARGVGEASVAVAFGALPVTGAAWLQSGVLDAHVLLLSVPVSLWVAAILLINEVPDIVADGAVGKRTLALRLGVRGARRLYLSLQLLAVIALAVMAWQRLLALAGAMMLLVLVPLFTRAGVAIGASNDPERTQLLGAIRATLLVHALGCLWLCGWILLSQPGAA